MIYHIMLEPEELKTVLDALLKAGTDDTDNVFAVVMAYKTVQERDAKRRYIPE